MSRSGNIVSRSRSPLPPRIVISLARKSTSLTRSCNASSNRIPVPYNNAATTHDTPRTRSRTSRTSSLVSTTGTRAGRFARTNASSHPTGSSRTSWYRNTSAERAWFCVDAATRRSIARLDKNRVTSPWPSSRGWRRPQNRM